MKWLLVAVVVGATVMADLLQSLEMKRHGEISDFRLSALGSTARTLARRKLLLLAIAMLAVSFFAFLKLLQVADLSFAVPATAASYVIETVLARYALKEHIDPKRWAGALMVAAGVAMLSL